MLWSLKYNMNGHHHNVISREKKFIHISQGFYRLRFSFHFLRQMQVYLVGDATHMLYSEPSTILLARGHLNNAFDQFWKIKFHFKHFPKNTQLLSFDGPSNCLYLFKNHRQTFSWPGDVRHPASNLLKCDLVQKYHPYH